jgi:hypothetical protein
MGVSPRGFSHGMSASLSPSVGARCGLAPQVCSPGWSLRGSPRVFPRGPQFVYARGVTEVVSQKEGQPGWFPWGFRQGRPPREVPQTAGPEGGPQVGFSKWCLARYFQQRGPPRDVSQGDPPAVVPSGVVPPVVPHWGLQRGPHMWVKHRASYTLHGQGGHREWVSLKGVPNVGPPMFFPCGFPQFGSPIGVPPKLFLNCDPQFWPQIGGPTPVRHNGGPHEWSPRVCPHECSPIGCLTIAFLQVVTHGISRSGSNWFGLPRNTPHYISTKGTSRGIPEGRPHFFLSGGFPDGSNTWSSRGVSGLVP